MHCNKHTFARQSIDTGTRRPRVAIAVQPVGAQRIDRYKDNVGLARASAACAEHETGGCGRADLEDPRVESMTDEPDCHRTVPTVPPSNVVT